MLIRIWCKHPGTINTQNIHRQDYGQKNCVSSPDAMHWSKGMDFSYCYSLHLQVLQRPMWQWSLWEVWASEMLLVHWRCDLVENSRNQALSSFFACFRSIKVSNFAWLPTPTRLCSHKANWLWTESPKTVTQNKLFPLISWFSWGFVMVTESWLTQLLPI